MSLVVVVTVTGLQAVGAILVVALLVIPPSAARFWTNELRDMTVISALIGGLSCYMGASLSALMENLPAGAVIVIVCAFSFLISLLFGKKRGFVWKIIRELNLKSRINMDHLLRAVYEIREKDIDAEKAEICDISLEELIKKRSWSRSELSACLRKAVSKNYMRIHDNGLYCLKGKGFERAKRIVRNHRLWEMFLLSHADMATGHVDHLAESVEHILDEDLIRELEELLRIEKKQIPQSPHEI
jgi:manganese/zinc/iron transport system permease protein